MRRLRQRAWGRLAAALLGATVLQLTAVTHLHVAHDIDLGAAGSIAVAAPGETVVTAAHGPTADDGPACPLCLIRAQTYSFATGRFATVVQVDGAQQHPVTDVDTFVASREPGAAAPRGPPTPFT